MDELSVALLSRLVDIKARRADQARQHLKQQKLALDQHQDATAQARQVRAQQEVSLQQQCDQLLGLGQEGQGFSGLDMLVQQHLVSQCEQQLQHASRSVVQCEQREEVAQQAVHAARSSVSRLEQQQDQLKDRIHALQQDRQRAEDDAVDEESEEVAVARLLRRTAVSPRPTTPRSRRMNLLSGPHRHPQDSTQAWNPPT